MIIKVLIALCIWGVIKFLMRVVIKVIFRLIPGLKERLEAHIKE